MTPSLSACRGACPIPSGLKVKGSLRVPPSKSVTQRVLNLALLSGHPVEIQDPLISDDTRLFLSALERVGFAVRQTPGGIDLTPARKSSGAEIRCGDNGTMLRFLTAALTTLPGIWTLEGSARLRRRPIGPLVAALRSLGAELAYLGEEGFAPLSISGGSLRGGYVDLDARLSSQFASALLMAASQASDEVVLRLSSLVSAPYLELTRNWLQAFGGECERLGPSVYRVSPGELRGGSITVEGDFSAAAYPAAAALLTGGQVRLFGLQRGSRQGDRRFLEVLQSMGGTVEWGGDGVLVRGEGRLVGLDIDLRDLPDQVPTVAALAPFAEGTTQIRNVPHLRIKECDRLAAMASQLRRLGAEVDESPGGLSIRGGWSQGPLPAGEVAVETYGDHRIAMSLAICGLRRPGVIVLAPEVVTKSYPSFWLDLEHLLRG